MFLFFGFYGRFLSIKSASMAKPMMITIIISATAGTKQMSAADCAGDWVGAGVGAAGSTAKNAAACEG